MSRTGKIARLPQTLRTQLNERLYDGEPQQDLVAWLNAQPEVQKTLAEHFGGRPISEQNLSEWRQGGYADWLRLEESSQVIATLHEHARELDLAARGQGICDQFSAVLAAELVALSRKLLDAAQEPAERWKCLREILRELSRLRRDDHAAASARIAREKWARQQDVNDRSDERAEEHERLQRMNAPMDALLKLNNVAKAYGGSDSTRDLIASLMELEEEMMAGAESNGKLGHPNQPAPKPAAQANPSGSNQIKPNQA